MHIEPLIAILKKNWLPRILLYVLTNLGLIVILEVWKMPLPKMMLLFIYMIVYMVCYENLRIMFDRLKKK
ncbi:MAG: hypothetical protein MJB14_00235 [Spirochaetes bacterium]|nr:hypothetical protein [Spirochaetota bacterium]